MTIPNLPNVPNVFIIILLVTTILAAIIYLLEGTDLALVVLVLAAAILIVSSVLKLARMLNPNNPNNPNNPKHLGQPLLLPPFAPRSDRSNDAWQDPIGDALFDTQMSVEQIVSKVVKLAQSDPSSRTPLHRAAELNISPEIVTSLAYYIDVDSVDENGRTPLFDAYSPEVVRRLIRAGANPNHLDRLGHNALFHILQTASNEYEGCRRDRLKHDECPHHNRVMDTFWELTQHADFLSDFTDRDGNTWLHIADGRNLASLFDEYPSLFDAVGTTNNAGQTPLQSAITNRDWQKVRAFLSLRQYPSELALVLLHILRSARFGQPQPELLEMAREVVTMMSETKETNWNQTDDDGNNLFHHTPGDALDLLEQFRQVGVEVNRRNKMGRTPFFEAVRDNDWAKMRFLYDTQPSLASVRDIIGHTPLEDALINGHDPDTVCQLAEMTGVSVALLPEEVISKAMEWNGPFVRKVKERCSRSGKSRSRHHFGSGKFKTPRKWSREYCKKKKCADMGFSEKASCRPYKNCYKLR
jgi:ankyrin repeat protein